MKNSPRIIFLLLLTVVLTIGATTNVAAQTPQPASKFKPVVLKPPTGYLPADFPEKRAGKLMLDPKKPAGMFIVYPKAGESADALPNLLKSMTVGMFIHDSKTPAAWTATPLQAHQGIDNESGTLYATANDKMEIQLAVYTRTVGETTLLYGYYGMRERSGKHKDDAPFMDSTGKGVENFDKFAQSIHASK